MYMSRIDQVLVAMTTALEDAVRAGGYVYANAVKRKLAGGYTSGDFVTGNTTASVRVTEPQQTAEWVEVRVGTDLLYNLFWEIGHRNIFTRRFERVEVWRPTLLEERERIRAVILATASARIQSMVQ